VKAVQALGAMLEDAPAATRLTGAQKRSRGRRK
jgi:hypothetical protein